MHAARIGLGIELETATLAAAVEAGQRLPREAWLSLNVSPTLLGGSDVLGPLLADEARPIVLEVTEHEVIDDYESLHAARSRSAPTSGSRPMMPARASPTSGT